MQEADEQSEGKSSAWSAGGELERCGGESARLVYSLDVCLIYVIIFSELCLMPTCFPNLFQY